MVPGTLKCPQPLVLSRAPSPDENLCLFRSKKSISNRDLLKMIEKVSIFTKFHFTIKGTTKIIKKRYKLLKLLQNFENYLESYKM